jgi:putative transposase
VIHADVRRCRLSDTFHTRLYASREEAAALARDKDPVARAIAAAGEVVLKAGESVVFDGRICTIAAVSATTVLLRPASGDLLPVALAELEELSDRGVLNAVPGGDGQPISCFPAVSPVAAKEANRRFQILERFWSSKILEVPYWQRAYKKAERDGLAGIRGLYPKEVGRKEGPQLPEDVELIVAEQVEGFYETLDGPSKKALHDQIKKACEDKGLDAPSYATVLFRLKDRDLHDSDKARAGRKRAYKSKPFYWYLASDTPRHGERPWERGHIDHTELDVVLVDSETGLPLERPWLTLLIDAFSRRVLAYWITFDEPSYRSVMMVMRRCVERWARLPEEIIVDGGVEFGSVYFEQLCAMYKVSPLVRPGEPRFGAVIERFFGSLNTRFIHLLRGNTKATKNVRELTKETDPANRAVWTLSRLAERLDEFFFDLYDTLSHPAFGASPREVFDNRMALTGQRTDRLIATDETFRMAILPSTRKGTARVDKRNRGVKINGRFYNAPEFRAPGVPGSIVAVKFDPADVRRAFAFVGGRWIVCYCQELRRFPAVSEREVGFLSAESYRRLKLHQGRAQGDNRRIADFVADKLEREKVLLQERKDAQAREIGASGASPTEPEPASAELPALEPSAEAPEAEEVDLVLQSEPAFETYEAYS